MATKESTGFASRKIGPEAFEAIFYNGVIEIRTGPQPVNADAAATGTLVARITRDGGVFTPGSPTNGLRFVRNGRIAFKDPDHDWRVAGVATGIAGWFRLKGNALDANGVSLSLPRIDGSVGLLDAVAETQLYLPTVAMTAATTIVFDQWAYIVPPIGE